MLGTLANPRHQKPVVGPFRGMETNIFDETQVPSGAVALASNVIFDTIKEPAGQVANESRGIQTSARVRPGRSAWNNSQMFQRNYLSDMEEGDTGWTNGTDDTTVAKTGYHSRKAAFAAAATQHLTKTFTTKDLTLGGVYKTLDKFNCVFWIKTDSAANLLSAGSGLLITSDAVPNANPTLWANTVLILVSNATVVSNTWTKVELALDQAIEVGTFDPATVTACDFILTATGACNVWLDESYIECLSLGHNMGLGEFFKPSTQDRFLLAKFGETLYIDQNASGDFEKIVSGLDLNTPAYFSSVYNQIFVSDGTDMWAIDGTQSTLGTWNYRPIGFTAPTLGAMAAAAAAGGTMTAGAHVLGLSYVYGHSSTVYGESNVTVLNGSVTVDGTQKISVSGIPVPAESEGVTAKRLYCWLADESSDTIGYFVTELAAATTTYDVDIDDVTLSAFTNPIAPRDNGAPDISRYLVPYEGSMIYLREDENPVVGAYSRRGTDLSSGPEIVAAGNEVANQRGEAWTGGISRYGALYLFTRKSIYKGGFTPQGTLYLRQLEAATLGTSESAGALDQRSIWLDGEGFIVFLSEQGICVMDTADKIQFLSRTKLRDEWKDINSKDPQNGSSYKAWFTQGDWKENTAEFGNNMDANTFPGMLTYRYPNNLVIGPARNTPGPLGGDVTDGSGGYAYNDKHWQQQSTIQFLNLNPGLVVGSENGTGSIFLLFQAVKPVFLKSVSTPFFRSLSTATGIAGFTVNIYKYKYEAGRKATADLSCVGTLISTQAVNGGDNNSIDPLTGWRLYNLSIPVGLYVPAGEMLYIEIQNSSLSQLIIPAESGSRKASQVSYLDYITSGNVAQHIVGTTAVPNFSVVADECQSYSFTKTGDLSGSSIQPERYGFVSQVTTAFHATGEVLIEMAVADIALTSVALPPALYEATVGDYTYFSPPVASPLGILTPTPPINTANPFFVMPASRPGPDASPAIIPAGYPNTVVSPYVAVTYTVTQDSKYGSDITYEAQSLISDTYFTTFWNTNAANTIVTYSGEDDFQEPLVDDTWYSDVIDMGSMPIAWGRFNLDGQVDQQFLHLEAATSATSNFSAVTWSDIPINTVPTTTQLPIAGQFLKVRIRFEDDPLQAISAGVSSVVRSLVVHWKKVGTNLRPLAPPAGCYFGLYSLVAYPSANSVLNNTAWCLSPGYRLSQWTNQIVNCWCIYDNKLLAGMAQVGVVTQYWDEDYADFNISTTSYSTVAGRIVTHPEKLGSDNVKTLSGITLFTGRREFKKVVSALKSGPSNVLPFNLQSLKMGLSVQSGDYTASLGSGPFPDYGYTDLSRLLGSQSGSTPRKDVAALSASYFFDVPGRQEEAFRFTWVARAQSLYDSVSATYTNCFPYLTKIVPEIYVENYGGVFQ